MYISDKAFFANTSFIQQEINYNLDLNVLIYFADIIKAINIFICNFYLNIKPNKGI